MFICMGPYGEWGVYIVATKKMVAEMVAFQIYASVKQYGRSGGRNDALCMKATNSLKSKVK